jgi:hypothetical protein
MAKRFKYTVCQVQAGHVTYVNGSWQGNQALPGVALEQLIRTCPALWEYLNFLGKDGWELVAVARQSGETADPAQAVYHYVLKREGE